jgi:hypothetical protein
VSGWPVGFEDALKWQLVHLLKETLALPERLLKVKGGALEKVA